MLSPKEIKQLIDKSKNARNNAFVPRSDHKIGACILTTDNQYFEGCNTESVISGLGVCAETSAMDHAVIHGKYEFKALAVIDEDQTFPCGSCLQYLSLFYQITQKEIGILVSDIKGNYLVKTLSELLPHGYLTKDNLMKIRKYKNKPSND